MIRKSTLESKIFRGKAKVMREAMLKISKLREIFVFDETYLIETNNEQTLFDKLGGIEGIKSIV